MTDSQGHCCDDDHRTFQDHECSLVVGQLSSKSVLELCDTKDATDVDRDGRNSDNVGEDAEHGALSEVEKVEVEVAFSCLACSVNELHAKRNKDCQTDDLERKTGHHDVDTIARWVVGILCGSQSSSYSLEQETNEVANHEREGVELRGEARDILTIHDNDTTKTEVYGSCKECRANGEAHKIPG